MEPRLRLLVDGLKLADQVAKGAVRDALLVLAAPLELRRLHAIKIAPPGVAISAPLGMQGTHADKGARQRNAGLDEAPAETIEQNVGGCAEQSLARRPDIQLDDFQSEDAVEA